MDHSRLLEAPWPDNRGRVLGFTVNGSTLYGLSTESSDLDYSGIYVPTPEGRLYGAQNNETWSWRTAPEGVRGGPDDVDVAVHSVAKFASLVVDGNPSMLCLLWAPNSSFVWAGGGVYEEFHTRLREIPPSKSAGAKFLGYMRSQMSRFNGERSANVNRPELIERYGYDTKYAMHLIRLGLQGQEYLKTGRLEIPVHEECRKLLLDIRNGAYDFEECLGMIESVELHLKVALDDCTFGPTRHDLATKVVVDITKSIWRRHFEDWS